MCVDARTYGNDARFTRHSCTPNAEVRRLYNCYRLEENRECLLKLTLTPFELSYRLNYFGKNLQAFNENLCEYL